MADTVPEDVREAVMLSLDGLPPVQDANLHFFKNDAPPPFDAPAIKAMARELLAYRKLLSSTPPSREWRTIDSAPKDGTHVLVMFDGTMTPPTVAHWFGPAPLPGLRSGAWYLSVQQLEGPSIDPTHWMPLPPPPVEGAV